MCIMLSLTNYLLLIAMAFLVGGFALINKFGVYSYSLIRVIKIALVVVLIYDLFFDPVTVTSC